ncbi:MAG: Na+/H+ antiporter NhaA [Candidatus Nanopelagicaceae bacterium]
MAAPDQNNQHESNRNQKRIAPLRDFLANESASGILLMGAALLGLLAANLPISNYYFDFLSLAFKIDLLGIYLSLTVLKVINYGLMTIFFFVVGLEIKRELSSGHLSKLRQAAAPFFAALGGMLVPALIYTVIAGGTAPEGWAVPVATDIALAVGVLSLMGSRVTQSLKAFLLALAVIDDIGAIFIIAIVYSTGVIFSWIFAAIGAVIATLVLQKLKVMSKAVYVFVGLVLWYSLYKAGLHPTLAGVIMGLLTPTAPVVRSHAGDEENDEENLVDAEDGQLTIVELLENRFHSLSSFIVVPIFAFANAGVTLSNKAIESAITSPISWGIIAGLVIGKPIGIYLASKSAAKLNVAELPDGSNARSLIATGSTAGIGFTVAIFIAKLAFKDPAIQDLAVTAVIAGSLISGLLSVVLFRTLKN